ncbi:hypothetical protein ABPG72_018908 [Tetrahymena utriculariae]
MEQVNQKYQLPFENCLHSIQQNIIFPNIERMKEILKQVKQNYSNYLFEHFAQLYLSKLLQIIKTQLHQKEYENAIELLIFLDDLTQPHNYGQFHHIRITCLLFIGHYFRCVGDDHSAFQVVEQALGISNQHGSPFLKGLTYLNIGSLLSKLNDNEQAIKFYKQSILAFSESNEKLANQITDGQTRKKSQSFLYSHQNQSLALHNLGIEYEKNDDLEMAFLSYFNSYMNARDHLGSHHNLTKNFLSFLKNFVKKLNWQVQNIENLFEDPNSYLNIIRKQKKISNPYFETFNFQHMQNISKKFIERLGSNQPKSEKQASANQSINKNNFALSKNSTSYFQSLMHKESSSILNQSQSSKFQTFQNFEDNIKREEYHSILLATEEFESKLTPMLCQSVIIENNKMDKSFKNNDSQFQDLERIPTSQSEEQNHKLSKLEYHKFLQEEQAKAKNSVQNIQQAPDGKKQVQKMALNMEKIKQHHEENMSTSQSRVNMGGSKSFMSNVNFDTNASNLPTSKRSHYAKNQQRPFSAVSNTTKNNSIQSFQQNNFDITEREYNETDASNPNISHQNDKSQITVNLDKSLRKSSHIKQRQGLNSNKNQGVSQISFTKYLEQFDDRSFYKSYQIHQSQLRQMKQKEFQIKDRNYQQFHIQNSFFVSQQQKKSQQDRIASFNQANSTSNSESKSFFVNRTFQKQQISGNLSRSSILKSQIIHKKENNKETNSQIKNFEWSGQVSDTYMYDQQKSQAFSQIKEISQFQLEKDLFQKTYTNMPWKSYRMYNNVEKENNFLYKKIVDISAKDVQNEISLKEQKYELKQNNHLLVRVKKRQQNSARITEENRRMFIKLYTQKPHIDSHQQQQDYNQKKQIIKRLTRFPLSNSKCISNHQGSQESMKMPQSILPGNKSFVQQDTKYEEVVNEINQEEFQGMRDSLRDGSYKLINFATKDHNIMAQRPSSSCMQKSSQKNIQTAQKQHLNIQQIQNLIKNHINTDLNSENIPPKPKIVQKRAQSAMKTARYKQSENQMLFVPAFKQYPINTDDIQKQRIEECHTTARYRSDSFRQRKLSLPDSQQLQQFQQKEEDEEQVLDYDQKKEFNQISQQYEQIKNEKTKSKDNLQKQISQTKYQKGDSLNYSQSNINSINYQQSIEQRNFTQPEQSTITINQILKQQNSYQKNNSISASKYNCKDFSAHLEANQQVGGSIQVKNFFDDEKGIKQKYYYRNDLKNTEQSSGLRSSQDINEIYRQSHIQPIYQKSCNSINYSQVQNKNFETSIEQISNKNKNQQIYLEQLENLDNQVDQNDIYSDMPTIKTKKFDLINQRMMQIVQQKNQSQYIREQQQFTTMDNKKRNIEQDLEQSPTIRKNKIGIYYLNSSNKNHDSAEKSARKSYQQKILNGKDSDQQESFSFNLANLNKLNKQEQAERKKDYQQVSFRKKSFVSNSLNNNSIDNGINFLKMNATNNKTNQHLKQEDVTFQKIYDLPMSKRVTEQEQQQIRANIPQSINQNQDEKSTINNSKNHLSYVLPELSQRKDKTKKNV